jgi:hypothetical protein
MMKRETLMQKLSDKGVHVVGTTEDFYGYENGDGIWISAESTPKLFNYYGGAYGHHAYIDPKLEKLVSKNGWFFEWYDAGTMMIWPN